MFRRIFVLVSILIVAAVAPLTAQGVKLALLIPTLYGPNGLFVESDALLPSGETHSSHFNNSFQAGFSQFNISLGTQLATIPLPSPASGFTYTFDSSLGVFARSTASFGPLYTDRAETIGKGKYSFGVNQQFFSFDEIEGVDLSALQAVFTHDGAAPGGKADVVTTVNSIDTEIDQTTFFLTLGLSNRLDLSVAVPMVRTNMQIVSEATLQRLGTAGNNAVHFFGTELGGQGSQRTFTAGGSSSGIGDVILRLKRRTSKRAGAATAFGLDVRVPTGDEEDFLGTGAIGVKPFIAMSFGRGNVSPHINLAYQWNGDSVLAGDILEGTEGDMPDQAFYALGVDFGVSEKLTLAVDLLGQRVFDSPRLREETFVGLDAVGTTFPNFGFEDGDFNVTNGALGFKFNPAGQWLINAGVVFGLDNGGVRDEFTPLVGIEYSG